MHLATYIWFLLFIKNLNITCCLRLRDTPTTLEEGAELDENNTIEEFFVRSLLRGDALDLGATSIPTSEPPTTGAGCSVGKNGTLELALLTANVLQTQSFLATIGRNSFVLSFPEQPTPYKTFSLPAIQMPLETLDRSRECFRMFYKSYPVTFCAANTNERDAWMSALTEAVFCINSGTEILPSPTPAFEAGESISLPSQSTKEQRWEEYLAEVEKAVQEKEEKESTVSSEAQEKQTQEVEIVNLLEGRPMVFVNGERLPLFSGKKRNVDQIIEEAEREPVET